VPHGLKCSLPHVRPASAYYYGAPGDVDQRALREYMTRILALAITTALVAAAADTLIVGHKFDSSVGVYSCETGVLLYKIAVPGQPDELSLAKDGQFAFVTSYSGGSSITMIDLNRRKVAGDIALHPYRRLGVMHVSKSGTLYVTAAEPGALLVVDPAKRVLLRSLSLGRGAPRSVTIDSREQFAYVADPTGGTVSVIDLNARRVIREITTYGQTMGLTLNSDSTILYAATRNNNSVAVIGVPSNRLLHRWFIQGHPVRLAIVPGRGELLSTQVHTGDLALISQADGSEVARMPIGKRVNGIAVDRRGEHAYVSAPASNTVVQVSLRDWKRRRVFRTPPAPHAVIIVEDTVLNQRQHKSHP
jgi:DNA-binding beta-propeller fold protein YncE